jgi:nitronate monooxygenase
MLKNNELNKMLGIEFPIIMAPMFLVSNVPMMKAALDSGIAGAFPTLNFRNKGELASVLDELNKHKEDNNSTGTYGVNIIVQQTNPYFKEHLQACVDKKVPFYITSLGNPEEVIQKAHAYGAKVFCDVTNIKHAEKAHQLGCDGFIAVGQGAGGHAGPYPLHILVPSLREKFPNTPVIAAGGIANGTGLLAVLSVGAVGASIGTKFIACKEAGVNDAYKNAIVDSKMEDIVMTTRLSGTPCTIINTPYAKKVGYEQNWLEKKLSKNGYTKKLFKGFVQYSGMKKLEQSVKPANYNTLWCAGQSVELIKEVKTCKDIVNDYRNELIEAKNKLELAFN